MKLFLILLKTKVRHLYSNIDILFCCQIKWFPLISLNSSFNRPITMFCSSGRTKMISEHTSRFTLESLVYMIDMFKTWYSKWHAFWLKTLVCSRYINLDATWWKVGVSIQLMFESLCDERDWKMWELVNVVCGEKWCCLWTWLKIIEDVVIEIPLISLPVTNLTDWMLFIRYDISILHICAYTLK